MTQITQWKQVIRKAFGMKSLTPKYIPFGESEWKDYRENPYRVIYMLQLNQGIEKSTLYEFLMEEWLPALKGVRGCSRVEIANDFAPGNGYVLLEFWDTKEIHDEVIPQLWHGTHKHAWKKLREIAMTVFLWEGIIVKQESK